MRNLKRALSLTLASVMLLGMMVVGSSAAAGYDDVKDTDNVEAIEVLQAIEVMVGDERGFGPDRPVNRAEMAVVMGKLLSLDYDYYATSCPFNDVYDWARGWVGAAYANKILSGRSATVYDPGSSVTAVEAASMLMRALGYFQYANDTVDGFELSTVRQGTKIGIFKGVGSSATAPMTRNQVAQMVLNALQSDVVEPDGNTINLTTPDGTVLTGKVNYVSVTRNEPYAYAIKQVGASSIGSTNEGAIVELGERLYNGELKLYDNRSDEFARPSRTWEYKGKEIGTYMKRELIRAEYTTAINGKTLYDLLGKAVIEDNYVFYFLDGKDDPTVKAENMVRGNTKDYSTTGKGVLTQVFFDPDREEITITSIDTFLADVDDDYNEAKAELTVDIHENTIKGNDTKVTLDEVSGIEKYKDGDKVLVQVAWNGQSRYDIVRVMDPTDMKDVTLTKYSIRSYAVADGTQYDYAANGKNTMGALDELSSEGNYGDLQLADYTYNLWFDQYGYLIGNEQVEAANRYVFITGYNFNGSHTAISYATASAIFTDGTMDSITVDVAKTQEKIEDYNKTANGGVNEDPKWYFDFDNGDASNPRKSEYNMWFTYTTTEKDGGNVYTLTPVENWVNQEYAATGKINSYTVRVSVVNPTRSGSGATDNGDAGMTDHMPGTAGTTRHWAVGDEDSIYLTVDTKDVTSGTTRGISKVNGVFTGVQDVDIRVESKTDNKLSGVNRSSADFNGTTTGDNVLTDASVFAVTDDDNYIIAAVVIGKDTASTKNYGYVLGDAKDETYQKDGNYHYWSFEGVLSGKIETLTIRKTDVDEFKTLQGNIQTWMSRNTANGARDGFVEFEIDKDGYIVDAKRVAATDNTTPNKNGFGQVADATGSVYDEYDYEEDPDPSIFETYLMPWGQNASLLGSNRTQNERKDPTTGASIYTADFGTYSNQYTLHAGDNRDNQTGLTLAKDGTVVVVETEVYTGGETPKVVWTQFSDVKKAIEYLEKSDETDPTPVNRASAFTGWVAGPLNKKGTAEWIVLNTNQVKTVVTDGGSVKDPGGNFVWQSTNSGNDFQVPTYKGATAPTDNDIYDMLRAAGCTDIKKAAGNWTYTLPNGLTKTNPINPMRVMTIKIGAANTDVPFGSSLNDVATREGLTPSAYLFLKWKDADDSNKIKFGKSNDGTALAEGDQVWTDEYLKLATKTITLDKTGVTTASADGSKAANTFTITTTLADTNIEADTDASGFWVKTGSVLTINVSLATGHNAADHLGAAVNVTVGDVAGDQSTGTVTQGTPAAGAELFGTTLDVHEAQSKSVTATITKTGISADSGLTLKVTLAE